MVGIPTGRRVYCLGPLAWCGMELHYGEHFTVFLIVNSWEPRLRDVPRLLAQGFTVLASFYAWMSFYELRTDVLLQKSKVLLMPAALQRRSLARGDPSPGFR